MRPYLPQEGLAPTRHTPTVCFPPHDHGSWASTAAFFSSLRNQGLVAYVPASFQPPCRPPSQFGKGEGCLPRPLPLIFLLAPRSTGGSWRWLGRSKVNICCSPLEPGDSESQLGRVNRKKEGGGKATRDILYNSEEQRSL